MPNRPSSTTIKVITFDLDDTLWPARPVLEQAERETYVWFSRHAARITDQFSPPRMLQFRVELMRNNVSLRHRISDLRKYCYQQLALASGYNHVEADDIAERAFAVFIHWRQRVSCFDGVDTALAALSKHYLLGALTNGNANLEKIAVGKYFDFCISAEALNASKPDPLVFATALQHAQEKSAGTVKPQQVVHVGDDLQADIMGARRAGFYTVWLRQLEARRKEKKLEADTGINPDTTIDSIDLLPKAIEQLQTKTMH
ncbi:MAG: HAD family hydrolase [Pseudomonadales bacterium]|nr:HAD family hydrolase [Pseudomonadales bacterium]